MIRKILKSKMAISIFSSVSILGVGATVATVSTIIAHKNTQGNVYYKFNGKTFRTNSELMTYVNSNSKMEKFSTNNNYYLYNNQVYDYDKFSNLKEDIYSKTPITEYSTYRNPYEYVINNAKELSNQVLTTDTDKLINVYQGKDGNAYLSRQESIKSFRDYQKIYKLGNIINDGASVEFQNKHEAIQYLEKIVEKKLSDEGTDTDAYEMAGSYFTKDQVKDWIKSVTDIEYDYNGYHWSKLNHPDISEMNLTREDENANIQKYNPTKNSYWLNINSSGLVGTFSGPQYIETDDDADTITAKLKDRWDEVGTQDINSNLAGLVLFSSLVNLTLNSTASEDDNGWDVYKDFFNYTENGERDFSYSFRKSNNSEYNYKNSGYNFRKIDYTLNKIKGMSRWQKTLLFIQYTYKYTIMVNHSGEESKAIAFLNLLKEMLKNIIKANTSMFDDSIDQLFKDQTSMSSNRELNINDVVHMFINPSTFLYESPSKVNALDGVIQKFQSSTDKLFSTVDGAMQVYKSGKNVEEKTINIALENYKSTTKNGTKYYEIDGETLSASNAFEKIKKSFHQGIKDGVKGLTDKAGVSEGIEKLGTVVSKLASKFVTGFKFAKAAWEMGNLISPVKYATYEKNFGNGQKLVYRTAELKIPLLDLPIFKQDFASHVQIINVFENTSIVSTNDLKNNDLYVVLGSLYNGKKAAEDYLKEYIIAHPTRFVSTRQYFINIMSQQEKKQLTADPNKKDGLAKLDEFADEMFDKYFARKAVKMYFDGIDGFFDTPLKAKDSMNQKITHDQFVIKYKFTDQEGISKYYDDLNSLIIDQDSYNESNILQSKTILADDLVKTIKYDKLTEHSGAKSKVYGITFNGQKRYFLTEEDAKWYIYCNSDVTYKEDTTINYHVYFDDATFNNEADFYKWVKENTIMVNDNGEVIENAN